MIFQTWFSPTFGNKGGTLGSISWQLNEVNQMPKYPLNNQRIYHLWVARPFLDLLMCLGHWKQCDPHTFVKYYWHSFFTKKITFQNFSPLLIFHDLRKKLGYDFINFKNISFKFIFFQTEES